MSRLSPRICTVPGPDTLGVGQPGHFTARWTFWFGSAGVRIVKKAAVFDPGDAMGEPCEVFTDELRNHLSACFDQNSRPVVAVENADGSIELRKRQAGSETRYLWAGRQPQLFFNWQVLYYSAESDVVCFYLKDDGRTIYARMQRDDFAVEYTMNLLHCDLQSLEEVIADSQRVKMFCRTTGGRAVTLTSRLYPPFPATGRDAGYLSATLVSGGHIQAVFPVQAEADLASGAITLFGGAYTLAIAATAAAESAEHETGFPEGDYFQQVFGADAGQDAGAVEAGIYGGAYYNRVEHADAGTDGAQSSAALNGGAYTKAVIDGSSRRETVAIETGIVGGSYFIP